MLSVSELLAIAVVHALAVISPGPDFVVVVRSSALHPFRIAVFCAFGIVGGLVVQLVLITWGIGVIFQEYPQSQFVLKIVGALYLAYLGIKAIRAGLKRNDSVPSLVGAGNTVSTKGSKWELFETGFVTNVTNPKASLYLMALLSRFLGPEVPYLTIGTVFVILLIIPLVWFSLLTGMVNLRPIKAWLSSHAKTIDIVSGILLLGLGLSFLLV